MKGNYYWRANHFSLNHNYGRKGLPSTGWQLVVQLCTTVGAKDENSQSVGSELCLAPVESGWCWWRLGTWLLQFWYLFEGTWRKSCKGYLWNWPWCPPCKGRGWKPVAHWRIWHDTWWWCCWYEPYTRRSHRDWICVWHGLGWCLPGSQWITQLYRNYHLQLVFGPTS